MRFYQYSIIAIDTFILQSFNISNALSFFFFLLNKVALKHKKSSHYIITQYSWEISQSGVIKKERKVISKSHPHCHVSKTVCVSIVPLKNPVVLHFPCLNCKAAISGVPSRWFLNWIYVLNDEFSIWGPKNRIPAIFFSQNRAPVQRHKLTKGTAIKREETKKEEARNFWGSVRCVVCFFDK